MTLWAEVNASGEFVRGSGVTNVVGNAEGRFFTFNRDISKCAISASLNEGPAATVRAERSETTTNQVITTTVGEAGGKEHPEAGGVDLIVSC